MNHEDANRLLDRVRSASGGRISTEAKPAHRHQQGVHAWLTREWPDRWYLTVAGRGWCLIIRSPHAAAELLLDTCCREIGHQLASGAYARLTEASDDA